MDDHAKTREQLLEELAALRSRVAELEHDPHATVLRVSEERFRLIARATGDALWDWDLLTDQVWWSEGIRTLFGYGANGVGTGVAWWSARIHPGERDRITASVQAALAGATEFWSGEYRFRRADETYADVLDRGYILRNEQGRPVRMMGAMVEISERKRMEHILRESRDQMETILQTIDDGIAVRDAEGHLMYVNDAFARIAGFPSRQAMLAASPADLLRKFEFRDQTGEPIPFDQLPTHRVLAGEPDAERLLSWRHAATQQEHWSIVKARAVRDTASQIRFVVTVAHEVTAYRRLEAQFRQAQKMEAVGQLAGGIAHEFNNLLAVINGFSELLLLDLPPGDSSRPTMHEIWKAGNRAASLTKQLLAYSRKQILQPKVLDLNALVADIERILRYTIGESVRLAIDLAPQLGQVKADPGQLEQVVMNLVVNARDAMPQGGELTLRTCNCELGAADTQGYPEIQPGRFVVLSVSDTGCGMDPETKARIFEPFFTTKEVGKGTGLGLSTVYGIVRQSEGHICVDSAPGKGSTFRVYLPRIDEALDAEPQAPADFPRGTETILLVEDEDTVRGLASTLLRRSGYTVLEARTGPEALALAAQHTGPIQLLVTDVVMPQMSGRELAGRLLAAGQHMRVIYLSGYTEDEVVRHGVEEANVVFLQKPFSMSTLAQKVRDTLDGKACR